MKPGYLLIVDDDPDIQIALSEFLLDEGYATKSVSNGEEALELLREGGELPKLILLDLMMPVLDGFEFRKLQMQDPNLSGVPTVLLSADGNLAEKAIRIGVSEYLQKPVRLGDLFQVVRKFFS